MKPRVPSLTGAGYGYLGHFRQERFVRAGHNTSAEPAATQEMIRKKFGRSRESYEREEDRQDRAALRRIAGDEAKDFRKKIKGAGAREFDSYQEWKQKYPNATPQSWAIRKKHVIEGDE